MEGSIHLYRHVQQYKCPQRVTTGSDTASKQMLHENRSSLEFLLILILLAALVAVVLGFSGVAVDVVMESFMELRKYM